MPTNLTEKQLAANRANAALSTGPRTPEGKARAAQNARRHGFTGSTFAVVRLEDVQEIAHLKADLVSVYQPANSQQLFALERVALAQQAILRAARLESGLFTSCLDLAFDRRDRPWVPMADDLVGEGDIEITRAQNRNFGLANGFHRLAKESNSWSLFLRYQAQAERHYRRAVEEFERLRALPPGPDQEPEVEIPNEPIFDTQPEETTPDSAPETNPSEPAAASHPLPECPDAPDNDAGHAFVPPEEPEESIPLRHPPHALPFFSHEEIHENAPDIPRPDTRGDQPRRREQPVLLPDP